MSQSRQFPGLVQSTLTGAATLTVLYLLCWAGAQLASFRASHMFIGLFTPDAPASVPALYNGGLWALVFGAVTGLLVAVFFRLFGGRAGNT